MSNFVKIPLDKSSYSLFINSKIKNKIFLEEYGTLIEFEGTALLFYSYSNHRRAYVIATEEDSEIPLLKGKLPLVKYDVMILYEAKSRKVDLLKFAIHNLEKMYGEKIYSFPSSYWILTCSLIDSYNKHTSTAKTKRNLKLLTDRYIKRNQYKYESN